jgi:hypothetical protein
MCHYSLRVQEISTRRGNENIGVINIMLCHISEDFACSTFGGLGGTHT